MTPFKECGHLTLNFQEGGFEIACNNCGACWHLQEPYHSQGAHYGKAEFVAPSGDPKTVRVYKGE